MAGPNTVQVLRVAFGVMDRHGALLGEGGREYLGPFAAPAPGRPLAMLVEVEAAVIDTGAIATRTLIRAEVATCAGPDPASCVTPRHLTHTLLREATLTGLPGGAD